MYTYEYPHPAVTADSVVFGLDGVQVSVLLIERGLEPFKGSWALPGGFMEIDETIEQCAARELKEETGLHDLPLMQFHTFSRVGRDPRERVLSVAFLVMINKCDIPQAGDDAAKAQWFPLNELPPLAFDHDEILTLARMRLSEILEARHPNAINYQTNKYLN